MSIGNELSCDVATAMLADLQDEQAATPGDQLTGIVLEVHSTLRRLTNDARRRRSRSVKAAAAQTEDTPHQASGNH
jgi:hypothetical protein